MNYWDYYWRCYRYIGDTYKRSMGVQVPKFVFDKMCLFIHIPKAAGMSVTTSLYGREIGHTRLSFYRNIPNGIYVFSVVRNPFDRVVSAWRFLMQGGMLHHPNGMRFKRTVLDRYVDFNDFVCGWLARGNERAFLHFIPQNEFLVSRGGCLSRIHKIIRFESLNSEFDDLRQKFVGIEPLKKVNVSGDGDYREYYNKESLECVRRVYSEDFRRFGYEDSF